MTDTDPLAWLATAACRGMSADDFVPKDTGSPPPSAFAACRRCSVTRECEADRGDDIGLRAGRVVVAARKRRTNICLDCGRPFRALGGGYERCGACARRGAA